MYVYLPLVFPLCLLLFLFDGPGLDIGDDMILPSFALSVWIYPDLDRGQLPGLLVVDDYCCKHML